MTAKGVATDQLARHLHAAIERVREDMAKVEFWADAVSGFSEPVPEYHAEDVQVWLPPEQAQRISSAKQISPAKQNGSRKQRRSSKPR
jgi:hypothetical protein